MAAVPAVNAEPHAFDPIAMEVFSNRLLSITEEMGSLQVRASFSPNIKERKDCSVALFDARGRLIAQAAHIPMHLGSLAGGVEATLREYGPEDIADGDAFMCNDPYLAGGSVLLAVILGLLAAVYPSLVAAGLDPNESLRAL